MPQRLLDGSETVVNRGEQIRELYKELGPVSIDRVARIAIDRGVFDEDYVGTALLKAAKASCRQALKHDDAQGLPFAGPVREYEGVDIWVQRELWTYDDYIRMDVLLSSKESELATKRAMIAAERVARFGA